MPIFTGHHLRVVALHHEYHLDLLDGILGLLVGLGDVGPV